MLFVTALSHTLKASSIKVYLAGVRALHIEHGFDNPLANCLRLERILRGIRRVQGSGTRPRLPITITILRRLHSIINTNIYVDALMWAASCVGFFGFLRCGEFTTNSNSFDPKVHLTLDDIKIDRHDNPSRMMVTIKSSKTDQFRQGYVVRIGRAHSHVCAIQALMNYLHLRGNKPGPLFLRKNGFPLTRDVFITWLRNNFARLGLKGNYSGHRSRIGAATTAATAGIPDHLIKTLGRWLGNAYQIYIRTPPSILEGVAGRLAR